MKNERLVIWNPLVNNPFSRFDNEMIFVKMVYETNFVLIFKDYRSANEYRFTYEKKEKPYPIITFRIFEEMARPDIEDLISKMVVENINEGRDKLEYEPTFYKVENSCFLRWYDNIFGAREVLQPNAEHHLFITLEIKENKK